MADALQKLLGLAAVGVAGYFAYEYFFAPAVATPPPATGGAAPAAPPPVVTTPPPPGPCSKSGVLAAVLDRARKSAGTNAGQYGPGLPGTYTIDEWGYFLNQGCTGQADDIGLTADALFPGQEDRGGPLNWSAFAGYAQQKGLSGFSTMRRPIISPMPFGRLTVLPRGRGSMGWRAYYPPVIGSNLVRVG